MQGVIKAYDPVSREGLVVSETDRETYALAPEALEGSPFQWLRQGQRIVFELDGQKRATHVRLGSEVDLGLPEV